MISTRNQYSNIHTYEDRIYLSSITQNNYETDLNLSFTPTVYRTVLSLFNTTCMCNMHLLSIYHRNNIYIIHHKLYIYIMFISSSNIDVIIVNINS